jgi:hypothetical protein
MTNYNHKYKLPAKGCASPMQRCMRLAQAAQLSCGAETYLRRLRNSHAVRKHTCAGCATLMQRGNILAQVLQPCFSMNYSCKKRLNTNALQ